MDNQIMPDSLVADPIGTPAAEAPQTEPVGTDASSQVDTQAKVDELANLEKRLVDTQAALKAEQASFHELKGQVAQINTQISAQNQEAPVDMLQSDEFLKLVDDDPAKAVQQAMLSERERMAGAFVEVMDKRDAEWEKRMSQQFTLAPEKQALATELSELGQSVPGFNELPDETKLSMAKAVRSAKVPETLAPPGNPAGTGYSEAQMQTQAEEKAKKTKELMLRMFGGEAVAGSELFPSVTDIGSQFKTNGV